MNHRPLGYEPNELPGCSTPHSYDSDCNLRGQTACVPRMSCATNDISRCGVHGISNPQLHVDWVIAAAAAHTAEPSSTSPALVVRSQNNGAEIPGSSRCHRVATEEIRSGPEPPCASSPVGQTAFGATREFQHEPVVAALVTTSPRLRFAPAFVPDGREASRPVVATAPAGAAASPVAVD